MTELEPAAIGDELMRERVAALENEEIIERNADGQACVTYRVPMANDPYAHWLGGSVPETLAGTAYPGDVHLAVCKEIWTRPEVPTVDLSWTPTDPYAALGEILERLEIRDIPRTMAVVTLEEVAAILGPDWTGGMDSVEWVRAQRDDDPNICTRDAVELEITADEPTPTVQVSVSRYDHQTGQMVDGWPENWPTQELQAITEEDQ